MNTENRARTLSMLALTTMLLVPAVSQADKFEGARRCRTCHEAKAKGAQFTAWQGTGHAKAFAVLATEEARKVGTKAGVADPQTDAKCLKCHVTGFGAPAEKLGKKYAKEEGVTCEGCHGPGEKHLKARLSSEDAGGGFVEIPGDELVKVPPESTCKACHNEESPTFKPFNYADAVKQIAHPNPSKPKK